MAMESSPFLEGGHGTLQFMGGSIEAQLAVRWQGIATSFDWCRDFQRGDCDQHHPRPR
jgi:hypothetical protein